MRLTLTLIILLSLFGLTYLYGLPYMAKRLTINFLTQSQFQEIQIEGLNASFSGVHIDRVQFDKDGFNIIENIDLLIDWTRQKILATNIKQIKTAHIANSPQQLVNITSEILEKVPRTPVLIEHFTSDIATDYGDIRLEGSVNLSAPDENNEQFIMTRLRASQYQISFDAVIEGKLTESRIKDITATIEEGRTNIGPFQFSRGSGWITYDETKTPMTLAGQIDIGTGRFHDLALNRISLVIGGSRLAPDILFRSGLSGHPDLLFSLDYSGGENAVFKTVLKAGNLTPVFETLDPDKNVPEALTQLENVDLSLTYKPERRFPAGPYPFEILLKEDKKETLKGTALFYPDTLDLRGSAQSNELLAKAIANYFGLDPDDQNDSFLRLDTSLKSWFKTEPKN